MSILHIVPKFNAPGPSELQASFWMSVTPDPGPLSIPEVSANITDWLQDMYDAVRLQVKNVITAVEYTVYIYDLLTGLEEWYFDGAWTFTGGTASDYALNQQAATVSAKLVGRSRPGQKRMIPFAEGETSEGLLGAGAITALGNFANQWVSVRPPSASFTYVPGVVSRGAPATFAPFTGVVNIPTASGTVRTRKRGVGI